MKPFALYFVVAALLESAAVHASADAALAALQRGGHVLLMRHAQTVSGIGDPPNFKIGDCSTQRNLNEVGRAQARSLGLRLRQAGVRFDSVYTSAWCRCVDTAKLAFEVNGQTAPKVFSAMNSTFNDRTQMPNRTDEVRDKVATWRGTGNLALVSHMVNIQALTGQALAMNEVIVLRPARQTKEGFQIVGTLSQ